MIGKTISRYRIVEKLGEGGMGVVYKARDRMLDRFVALKVLPADKLGSPERKRRFVQEAKAASGLNHPNIITIYEIASEDGLDCMVLEYIDGKTLDQFIPRQGMRPGDLLKKAVQIADALAAAHKAGIVHRDLKPGNVMVSDKGLVKVLDFGLAKLLEPGKARETDATRTAVFEPPPRTVEGTILGTISYMSPEQAEGKEVDTRSDIFSFGSLLYEMATGRRAFTGETPASTLGAVLKDEPTPASQLTEGLPGELERIINRCLRKEPNRRFQGMADLKVALEELKDESRAGSLSGVAAEPPLEPRRKLLPLLTAAAALLVALAAGWWWRDASPPASSNGREASIAVMPFVNQSPEPDSEYFSDGMTDELISALTRVRGLKVVGRSSVFRFKGTDYDIQEVGERLGVGTVLEGTVRKTGERLRISVQLINVTDGFNLWSQTFDREIQDVFDVQEEVCQAMVEALQVHMGGGSGQPLVERYTDNWEAYDLYLRGRHHHWRTTEANFKASLRYYELAKELDPRYPLPYVGVAAHYASLGHSGIAPPRESLAKAERELEEALAINSTIPLAYSYLGYIRRGQLRWREAEAACKRAIELEPRLAHGYKIYGQLLGEMGRTNEAIAMAKRAVELEPATGNNRYSLGMVYLSAGQYDRAIMQAQRAIELDANNMLGHWLLGIVLVEQDRLEEAIESFEQARRLAPILAVTAASVGYAYGRAGKRQQAQDILDELLVRRKNAYVPGTLIAVTHAALGDDDAMFDWLETAYRDGDPALGFLKTMPWYALYRSDPRFQDLESRVGFPE
jgi:eukaryotic-like serine/threonine-protein kinase